MRPEKSCNQIYATALLFFLAGQFLYARDPLVTMLGVVTEA
ncbi:MAG: hypothetical protein ABIJ39_06595 [Chloroflexota bacterium]